jgi:PKD repeat protein
LQNFLRAAFMVSISVFVVYAKHAHAVPDIRGEYSGSYSIDVSNCSDPSDNGTYYADLALSITSQAESAFNGTATGSFDVGGATLNENIQLSGTITESGEISGTSSHTFLDTYGEGTFTGQLSGNSLFIENSGQDTSPGDTCTYIRYMSATREGTPASAAFSAAPTSGQAPLSVNFTDDSTGSITAWYWNLGDGSTSTVQNPSHTYDKEGTYSVSLTVSGPYGSDTETKLEYISIAGVADIEEFKMRPSDGAAYDHFGYGVSISGDYAVVGSDADGNRLNSGAAYIFKKRGNGWIQETKLIADDGALNDYFGRWTSVSGEYVIVGAFMDDDKGSDSGSAYIFEKSGSGWSQAAKLTAGDGAADDWFGYGVSIDGVYAIVGAYGDDVNGSRSGSAYIFERSGGGWSQAAKLTADDGEANESFGFSVSISDDYTVVGAVGDDDNGISSGSAYIFERNGSSWSQVAKLTAADGAAGEQFGWSVSISGGYVIVGAPTDRDSGINSGSAYIFEGSGSSWSQAAKLTAGDGAAQDLFGRGVSISGMYAIAGAFGDDDKGAESGSAYIFKRNGGVWSQVAKLTAGGGAADDWLGDRVAIFGGYAIAGSYKDDDNGIDSGSAYVFDLNHPGKIASPWIFLLLNDK